MADERPLITDEENIESLIGKSLLVHASKKCNESVRQVNRKWSFTEEKLVWFYT